jgi:hypothetical protein
MPLGNELHEITLLLTIPVPVRGIQVEEITSKEKGEEP